MAAVIEMMCKVFAAMPPAAMPVVGGKLHESCILMFWVRMGGRRMRGIMCTWRGVRVAHDMQIS